MDEQDGVNLFISEGAGVSEIVAAMEAAGEDVPRDPFGHVHLDKINPGQWFAKQFAAELGADKVLVQKSGYFSRSAAANDADLALIRDCTRYAVDAALRGESGVVGQDEERGGELRAIEFERIAGGKRSTRRCRGSPTCCAISARPDPMIVRPVRPEDREQWQPLWDGYNLFYERVLPDEITEMTWAHFFNADEPVFAAVAERDGKLVGLVHYLHHRNTTMIEDICYLQDLFTAPEARGTGVGRALIEHVYGECGSGGAFASLLADA